LLAWQSQALTGVTLITPADNANISGIITLNATFGTPLDVGNVSFYFYNGSWNLICQNNSDLLAGGTCSWNSATIADGVYTFNVTATDAITSVSDNNTNIRVDNFNPTISLVDPTETADTFQSRDYIQTNVTAFDGNFKNVTTFLYNSSGLVSSITNSTNVAVNNFTGLADGEYHFNATATDLAGNQNETETRDITIDTTAPAIDNFTLSDTTVLVGETITGNCTATDNIDTDVNVTVTGIDTSSAGTRNATCTAEDDAGNSNSTNASYTVNSPSPPGGGGGGGGGKRLLPANTTNFSITDLLNFSIPKETETGTEDETEEELEESRPSPLTGAAVIALLLILLSYVYSKSKRFKSRA